MTLVLLSLPHQVEVEHDARNQIKETTWLGLSRMWGVERVTEGSGGLDRPKVLLGLWQREALDATDIRLLLARADSVPLRADALRRALASDVALLLARRDAAIAAASLASGVRVASVEPDATGGLSGEQEAEGVGDETRTISHYFCRNPWGDGGYCEWMACPGPNGEPQHVAAGFVAGPRWRCGQQVEIGEIVFTYGDTGSWPIQADEVIDVACYGDDDGSAFFHWGWPDTPEYEKPCPTFARTEVVTWLTP